jgi:hypothetical protein
MPKKLYINSEIMKSRMKHSILDSNSILSTEINSIENDNMHIYYLSAL